MNANELIKKLKKDGWSLKTQSGSHKQFIHPTKKGKITVPNYGKKDLKKNIEVRVLKQAGLK